MRKFEDNLNIEMAIKFLVTQVIKSGNNPKPVILHSIKVALCLDSYGYSTEIVIAALLHDLLEDSKTTLKDIEDQFGKKIAKLVEANSFDKKIADKRFRFTDTFNRCLKLGKSALLIKSADILDNADYYSLAENKDVYFGLLEKLKYFLDISNKLLNKEPIYKKLSNRYKALAAKEIKKTKSLS